MGISFTAMASEVITSNAKTIEIIPAPFRVISLSPHTTELAYEAGLGENLIAVSAHSDHPPEAQKLEQVANFRGINIERVVMLKPSLVLAWKGGNPEKELAKLKSFGIKMFYSNPHSLYDAADNIEILGKYSSEPEKAKERANALRSALDKIKEEQKNKRKISYFYQLSTTPLMTNNAKHWPQPLFSLCGGENIFGQSPAAYPQIGIEKILMRNPEAIFYPLNIGFSSDWNKWKELIPAIKSGAIFSVTGDWLSRPTPRALKAVKEICDAFDKVRNKSASHEILQEK